MLITTGKVTDGKVHLDSKGLPDGARVTVLAQEGDETFELSSVEQVELRAAIAQAERGELISANELLQELRNS
jgi:hypothetical protein